jgi:hypothetical protein
VKKNVKDQCLKISQLRKVNFDAGGMHKVFYILSRPRYIGGVDGHTIVDFIDFLKSNSDMIGNDSHSSEWSPETTPAVSFGGDRNTGMTIRMQWCTIGMGRRCYELLRDH